MRLTGTFRTPAGAAALRGLATAPEVLGDVPSFTDLQRRDDGTIQVQFHPVTSLGRVSLDTLITPGAVADDSAEVAVIGRRGNQIVDATIVMRFGEAAGDAGSLVTWEADVLLGGTAASVGQRVGGDMARRAIGDVLEAAARAASAHSS